MALPGQQKAAAGIVRYEIVARRFNGADRSCARTLLPPQPILDRLALAEKLADAANRARK